MSACSTSMPNISVIEKSISAPLLVSDDSVADLQCHFKTFEKNCTVFSVCRKESKCSCIKNKESPRPCLKILTAAECGQNRPKETADQSGCIEELYFNDEVKKSSSSSPRGHCINEKCLDFLKVKTEPSAERVMKIKTEPSDRTCEKNTQDSGATCSLVDSTSATCDANARASYYYNKLMATLQILQNKEEMISVQADSLAVAEERIATLNDRANELKRELDRKTKEYQTLRKSIECCKVEKSDVCLVTEKPMEDQTDIVNTLENNLSVIEDLYRECFYETAKQENLIEMLRSSYLDVRLMERQKADQIGRLQTVVNTQKWSLDKCHDIALEVEGLKMEISNFLNSSTSTNNDSGMWERSEESFASAPGVQDDLHDVTELLLRLQGLLAVGCTCSLKEENIKLKEEVENLEIKLGELRDKLCDLNCTLTSKEDNELKYKAELESKDKELSLIKEQLIHSQEDSREQTTTCDAMAMQLLRSKELLDEKTAELSDLQQENASQAHKIKDLQEELEKADQIIKENCKMRSEVSYLTSQVSLWRAQLDDSERRVLALDAELARSRAQLAHVEACYREKARAVSELQAHLEAAHARGGALCGEARRAVGAVRAWMRRMRDKHRDQENIIKEKETHITILQRRLEERKSDFQSQRTSASENAPTCSKCLSSRDDRSFCSKMSMRREQCLESNPSEIASCSSTAAPIRLLKKKSCANKCCKAWRCAEAVPVTQLQCGSSAAYCAHDGLRLRRDVSPTEELLQRVEQLSEALADGSRRWSRQRDAR